MTQSNKQYTTEDTDQNFHGNISDSQAPYIPQQVTLNIV
jgi:hypothetical protein